MSLRIEPYSEKSFVVRGDSRPWKTLFMDNGGKWNPNLAGGGALIFGNRNRDVVQILVDSINGNPNANRESSLSKNSVRISALPGSSPFELPVVSKKQDLVYTGIYKPAVGDKANIEFDGGEITTTVYEVKNSGNGNIDMITLSFPSPEKDNYYEAGVYAGKWVIKGEMRDHKITFHSIN